MACQALPAGSGFVSSTATWLDCQAQAIGSGAWQALALPGSTLTIVLTGFVTLLVALVGYNLLLGQSLTVRGATLSFVKIGAVLALATSWPAYRTLVYDIVVDGPAQLVSEIGPSAGIVGADGTMLQRLDLADRMLAQLAILGPGNVIRSPDAGIAPPPFIGFDAFAIGGARILFLLTAVAGLGAVRIVMGLLLALGPFFIAFLLFDSTRSLFEGWLRVLAGTAFATFGVAMALGLQLAMIEPWLSNILARRVSGEALPTVPIELFVLSCLFTIIVLTALYGCARITAAFRLSPILQLLPGRPGISKIEDRSGPSLRDRQTPDAAERDRAAAVANILTRTLVRDATPQREGDRTASIGHGQSAIRGGSGPSSSRTATPVGRSYSRRSGARVSARAAKRDVAG